MKSDNEDMCREHLDDEDYVEIADVVFDATGNEMSETQAEVLVARLKIRGYDIVKTPKEGFW